MTRSSLSKHAEQMRPHRIEWFTGILSSLLVLAITGWMLFEATTSSDRPPELSARVIATEAVSPGWHVMIQVENTGDQAAADVKVKATLRSEDTQLEEAELTFDYVAAGSTSRGTMIFVNNPSAGLLEIVPTSFTEP
jgi:uncharacterized protein (TIGR02588 family)